jgi:hypothetical protein
LNGARPNAVAGQGGPLAFHLELALRPRAVPCDRGELETWAADVWPLAEDDPDVIRWAEAFLAARQTEA